MALARAARERGNEGQARVCARRAAGAVIRAYYRQQGLEFSNPSAYDLLNRLAADSSLPETARRTASLLTLRVNEEFKLPAGIDLLEEAASLTRALFPEASEG